MFKTSLYYILTCFSLASAVSLGRNLVEVGDFASQAHKELSEEIIHRLLSLLLEESNDQLADQHEDRQVPISDQKCDMSYKVGAFNIQVLGVKKLSKPEVFDIVLKILGRYDIVLIQEIRDKSEKAIVDLFDALNKQTNNAYKMVISDRLGRSSSKEQYAFFYRDAIFQVVDSYVYNDVGDKFEREPFIVRFAITDAVSTSNGLKEFAFAGIHVKPQDAKNEIDHLTDVYDDIVSRWGFEDVVLGGDFNADCSYLRKSAWQEIRLWTQDRFKWIFGSNVDSTVAFNDCAYDRLVVAGPLLSASIIPSSPAVFHFDQQFSLSHDEAEEISDHYPIELSLSACPDQQSSALDSAGCPSGWTYYAHAAEQVCIYIETSLQGDRGNAQQNCQNLDSQAYLIKIGSLEKQQFVVSLLGDAPLVWIGLNDMEQERVYEWADGTPLGSGYKNWKADLPEDQNLRDCVVLSLADNYQWVAVPCVDPYVGYACEMHAIY